MTQPVNLPVTPPMASSTTQDRPLLGIALMLGFCILIPLGDAVAKLLATRVPVGQIVFVRFAAQALILVPVALVMKQSLWVPRAVLPMVFLRTVLQMAGITAMFNALRYLPLADAVAIAFVMPFIMLLLGKYVLGEAVGLHRLAACVVGFVGTLLVIQPSFAVVGLNALWPLAVAFIFAFFMLVTRKIAKVTAPIPLQALSGLIASVAMLPLFWLGHELHINGLSSAMPPQDTWVLLGLAGGVGTIAHLLMTWSLRYAPASTLASMQYLEIPIATLVGWLVFNELPNTLASLGIALTVAAGLYAVMRERRAVQQTQAPTKPSLKTPA
ncbi:carboxylate/amino acid/amine transporter [Phaeobacter sp. CECT 5382]|uniref:DMT family transporter n=1 Tax=Phaeobacter sp. CECT 5382 TaxID=1712645 RepID=UPI0006D983CB|nr:DMT family transporter [Phaeobacter sp. CECT 5382]CUH88500.1 carboxylate/amino acid/amine transporter [Phaeobacter sp. CECT 5382]